MAQYPIKLLKDESGVPFVPLTSIKAVVGEEYIQMTFTATEDSTGHFTISNDKLTDEDLLNKIIAVSFPEDITATTNSYLKLNDGDEYLIKDENGTGPLLIKDFINVVCFLMKKESGWQLVKTGAAATSSSGGHTIVDSDGNVMPQQAVLQFKGFGVSDNAGTGATVISTPSLVNNLTTTESGTGPLDAYQGKVLNDKFANYVLNSTLDDYALKTSLDSYALKSSLDSYALKTSLNSYLPLSGGTLTGVLRTLTNTAPAINLREGHTSYDGCISYETAGNEAVLFTTKNSVTSFMFINGEDIITNASSDRWQSLTPGLQIKNNKVSIGSLIADGADIDYKLQVAGTVKADAFTTDGTCALVAQQSNELNFGGTNNSDTIFFGYRTAGSRPKPTNYVFGSGGGTASVKAAKYFKDGINVPGVYIQSSTPSAKQTGDIWFVT